MSNKPPAVESPDGRQIMQFADAAALEGEFELVNAQVRALRR